MGETGDIMARNFHPHLDPSAQEYIPRNPNQPHHLQHPHQSYFVPPPPPPPPPPQTIYYPYTPPPPPLPPHYIPPHEVHVQVMPFADIACVGYSHYTPSPAVVQTQPPQQQQHGPAPPVVAAASGAPTRALALTQVPVDVSESVVRRELEVFGEVRAVQMERVMEGIVTVHFYDLRDSRRALKEIRDQHMLQQCRLRDHFSGGGGGGTARGLISGRAVWAQYVVPSCNAFPEAQNQGTIVIFNLDPDVSTSSLKEIFQPFGLVKECRDTPYKKHQRFVEFFDIRHAAKALREMNGKEIHGRTVVIEFSRPGGYSRKFLNSSISTNTTGYPYPIEFLRNSPPPVASAVAQRYPSSCPPAMQQQAKRTPRKSGFSEGTDNPSIGKSSVEGLMGSLSIGGGEVVVASSSGKEEDCISSNNAVRPKSGNSKKRNGNGSNINSSSSSSSSKVEKSTTSKQQYPRSTKPWKNKHGRKLDSRFVMKEDVMAESSPGDTRTTVMIKNIPNKYSQKLLLNMLDNHCIHCNEQIGDDSDQPLSSYDFVYLPIDFNNKCNVGYGFVNMTSPQAAWRLYKAFHLRHWEVFNSRKICEVTYARIQGLEALKEHFKNSKFPCEMDHYLPVVFTPPRDGIRLTEPQPVVGFGQSKPMIGGGTAKSDQDEIGGEEEEEDNNDDDDEMDGGDSLHNGNKLMIYDEGVGDHDHHHIIPISLIGGGSDSSKSSSNDGGEFSYNESGSTNTTTVQTLC